MLTNKFSLSVILLLISLSDEIYAQITGDCIGVCNSNDNQYTGHCGAFANENDNWCTNADDEDICCASSSRDCCDTDGGAIAGLVIGLLIFLAFSVYGCYHCCCKTEND